MSLTTLAVAQHAAPPAPALRPPVADPKITPRHLARRALIYVRQSSPTQVQRHPESARRQYALTERAQRLGWPAEQVTIIDEDQGKSGAGRAATYERDGFAQLVSAVGLGEVGLILALEVSRFARNSAEWYRLLELAALAGVLIGDEAAIYDPRVFNDRLLLGLHGTISEVELHCIQARLQGARRSKAQRGELPLGLPVGLVRGCEGSIELDPDQEVQGALRTVFEQFEALGSANAVLRFFREHGLRLPRRSWRGSEAGQRRWAKPSYQAIHQFLVNPIYAGAYAYGQRGDAREVPPGLGRRGPRHRFALDELEVLIRDHHPGYVSWERYLANRALLRDNTRQFTPSRGAPRAGQALLQGIVFCGRCGCRMKPHYGACSPSYRCDSRHQHYGEPVCQSLTIDHVDQALSETFLAVVQPAEIEALLALSAELDREQAQIDRQWQLRLERARYEAERAGRQYDLCEPENRLVARELETRWNAKLRLVTELEEEYRREQRRGLTPLTEAEQALLRSLVTDVPTLWSAPATTAEERKRLVRCLVREVILDRGAGANGAGGITTLRIGWKSGAWTELRVRRPTTSDRARTPAPVLERLRSLASRLTDDRVAEVLNTEGFTTRMGLPWTAARVQHIRGNHRIPTGCPTMPQAGHARGDGLVPVRLAAEILGVAPTAIDHWRTWGFLHGEQRGAGSPVWVRLTAQDITRLDGTLAAQGYGRWRLREGQRILGLTKHQLWEKARQHELIAYRARVADHWEWRISLAQDHPRSAPSVAAQ
jgi:DNA invertase Pin-like site-specific DNA recombinase